MPTLSDSVRDRLKAAITCDCCNQQKMTFVELSRQVGGGLSDDVLSRFVKGQQVKSSQLDMIDTWVKTQEAGTK